MKFLMYTINYIVFFKKEKAQAFFSLGKMSPVIYENDEESKSRSEELEDEDELEELDGCTELSSS